MIEFLRLILHIIASFFKPRTKLVAEILSLRQQINVLRRQVSKRPQLSNTDRSLFVWLYRWFPSVLSAFAILRPETIIRWHRAGFQSYWRERSRKPVGRPRISAELRNLIRAPRREMGARGEREREKGARVRQLTIGQFANFAVCSPSTLNLRGDRNGQLRSRCRAQWRRSCRGAPRLSCAGNRRLRWPFLG